MTEPTRPPPPALAPAVARARPAAEVCQGGVVLRTLLFVHGVVALGLLWRSADAADWSLRLSLAVLAVLPATLIWLVGACAAQARTLAFTELQRSAALAGWGALCGLAAAGIARAVEGWVGSVAGVGASAGGTWALLAWPLTAAALAWAVALWLHSRERLRVPAATQARLTELQSRIRPHFLFNALNSAIALVQVDPQRAEGVLEDLAELFRAALVSGGGDQVSLGQEIELARRYLAIEQVRFGARLRVHWVLEPAADAACVPSLLLQPLVENAVRHGVEPSPDGGELTIRTQVHRGQALLSITNSVPAEPASVGGHGIALRNVRERLALLHDVTMRFEAGPVDGGRYRVRIALPLVAGVAQTAKRSD